MRPNPITDFISILTAPGWPAWALWLLLAASLLIAAIAWSRDPAQRSIRHLGIGLLRVVLGVMWWQQSLWKIPPNYGGLVYWMGQMVDHAAIPLQGTLVRDQVVPNIALFGPVVYAVEVIVALSLILGALSRFGAIIGLLMAVNLWLGLYSAPGEWPWTYGFLVLLMLLFAIDPPGRSLGLDALYRRSLGVNALSDGRRLGVA